MIQGIFVRLAEAILLSPFLTVKESGISGSFQKFLFRPYTLHSRDLTYRPGSDSSKPAGTDYIWKMWAIYQRYNVIGCFQSRGQHPCKFIGTKEGVCIWKEFNSQRIGLGHQYGRRDVMWKHSILAEPHSKENLVIYSSEKIRWSRDRTFVRLYTLWG